MQMCGQSPEDGAGTKELVSIRARKKIEGLDLESYSKKMEKIYTRVIKLQQRD